MITPEEIAVAATQFHDYMIRQRGPCSETNLSGIGSPTYKPFYGACSTLLNPSGAFVQVMLHGQLPTFEEAKAIASQAHPWFQDAISREPEEFEAQYKFLWDEDDD